MADTNPRHYCLTTQQPFVTTCYYTGNSNYNTEKAEYYTTTYTTPAYYTEEPKHYSAPSYNRVYYITIAPECYAGANRYTEAPKYYTIEFNPPRNSNPTVLQETTEVAVYYTTNTALQPTLPTTSLKFQIFSETVLQEPTKIVVYYTTNTAFLSTLPTTLPKLQRTTPSKTQPIPQ
ncbi:hypothetical protein DAPPUDRAFT_322450 [Daphnia pulex]|uniref:Uncharacterized protein n=1 Tax=Daphnia pulex TaxID=6669 RepID=E9GW14_DAPPU|nr:hypothetical protein DAPPUDRAFT_322450 [Daphnia pulex]|eukprot:EFX76352.1 hypothetical protein DAPPUDRAFT_322450 [Daphnia pulex]